MNDKEHQCSPVASGIGIYMHMCWRSMCSGIGVNCVVRAFEVYPSTL